MAVGFADLATQGKLSLQTPLTRVWRSLTMDGTWCARLLRAGDLALCCEACRGR